jgi:hypothetical protein
MRRAALVVAAGSFALAGCGPTDSSHPTAATGRPAHRQDARAHRPHWRSRVNHDVDRDGDGDGVACET